MVGGTSVRTHEMDACIEKMRPNKHLRKVRINEVEALDFCAWCENMEWRKS